MSNNTANLSILLLKLRGHRDISFMYWSVVLWRALKPNFTKYLLTCYVNDGHNLGYISQ